MEITLERWAAAQDMEFTHHQDTTKEAYFPASKVIERYLEIDYAKDFADKVIPLEFNNTCWGLAGRLLTFINNNSHLKIFYLGSSLIYKRAGIDSFMDKGIVHRLSITIDGFNFISTSIFGSSSFETNHIRRVIRNEEFFKLRNLLSIKYQLFVNNDYEQIPRLNKVVYNLFSESGIFNYIQYLIFISFNNNLLRAINFFKKFKKYIYG